MIGWYDSVVEEFATYTNIDESVVVEDLHTQLREANANQTPKAIQKAYAYATRFDTTVRGFSSEIEFKAEESFVDSDEDNISDEWELIYFDSLVACNPTDDPDHDDYSNLIEFQYGTNPASGLRHIRFF